MIQRIKSILGFKADTATQQLDVTATVKSAGGDIKGWATSGGRNYDGRDTSINDAVWAFAGIQDIATAVSSLPFILKNAKGEIVDASSALPIEMKKWLSLFSNPHPLIESVQLWEITTMLYEIKGLCFWILEDENGSPISQQFKAPFAITPVGPESITPRTTEDGRKLLGWYYTPPGSYVRKPLQFWQVIRFYKTNPFSLLKGVRLTDLIGRSISLDKNAKDVNASFFENGARRDGHLEYEGDLRNEEIRQWRDEYDASFAGTKNAYRTPVLAHGFKYVHDSSSIKDMDFVNLTKMTREEMIGAVRVPKHHLSLNDDVNHATADVGDRVFWQNNILPKVAYFQSVINSKLLFGTGLTCEFDTSGVYALKKDLKEKTSVAKDLSSLGYALNDINSALDLKMPIIEDEWASESHNPSELSNSNDNSKDNSKGKTAFFKNTAEACATSVVGILAQKKQASLMERIEAGEQKAVDEFIQEVEDETITPFEPAFAKAVRSYFERLLRSQLKRIEAFYAGEDYEDKGMFGITPVGEDEPTGPQITANNIDRILFTKEKWDTIIKEMSLPFHKKAYMASLKRVEKEIGGFINFETGSPEIAKEIAKVNARIVGINERLRKKMRAEIAEVTAQGASYAEVRAVVEKTIDTSLARTNAIVRTELGNGANSARWKALATQVKMKRWLTAGDEIVRESHANCQDAGSVPMDYIYTNGLRYPHDPNGDASEVVNCRCTLIKGK